MEKDKSNFLGMHSGHVVSKDELERLRVAKTAVEADRFFGTDEMRKMWEDGPWDGIKIPRFYQDEIPKARMPKTYVEAWPDITHMEHPDMDKKELIVGTGEPKTLFHVIDLSKLKMFFGKSVAKNDLSKESEEPKTLIHVIDLSKTKDVLGENDLSKEGEENGFVARNNRQFYTWMKS